MKRKFNPELLKEELSKFKLLSEYDFYQEKKELPEYKDLILGDIEEEEVPNDLEPAADVDNAASKVADDLGVDGEETTGDIPDTDPEMDMEPEQPELEPEQPQDQGNPDEVEVDVTSLVKGSEDAKRAADVASHNSEILLQKLSDLESRVASMDKVTAKIDDLEREIIKRNPTPVEKLEMRSLDSYPYSQKLTDYWADKEGPYNVMNSKPEKKEYVLTKDVVDSDYSESNVKNSFSVNNNDYEEEEI